MAGDKTSPGHKQQLFVQEYLVDLNATQAAVRAGDSLQNAGKIGPEMLGKTRIAEAIRVEMVERIKRTLITADRVLEEYAKIGFADLTEFVEFQTEESDNSINGSNLKVHIKDSNENRWSSYK